MTQDSGIRDQGIDARLEELEEKRDSVDHPSRMGAGSMSLCYAVLCCAVRGCHREIAEQQSDRVAQWYSIVVPAVLVY
jgi:hypothetical protein